MRTPGDAQSLSRRRLQAVRRVVHDKRSQAAVAREWGVHRNSVGAWVRLFLRGGESALNVHSPPGRPRKLRDPQVRDIVRCVLQGARAHGFDTDLWTLPRIAKLIERRHGVSLDVDHLSRLMRRWGLSWQKPAKRPLERDENAIARWVQREWPRVKKKSGD